MVPRPDAKWLNDDDDDDISNKSKETIVVESKEGIRYVRCNSSDSLVNPTSPTETTAKQVNAHLNLNLGLPFMNPDNVMLRKTLRWLNVIFLFWWEHLFFFMYNKVPLVFRQKLTLSAWNVYFPIHRYFLGRKTAIHPTASEEYHALTTATWWFRLIPVTIPRMRFALSQISACHPSPKVCDVDLVSFDMGTWLNQNEVNYGKDLETRVSGYYVQNKKKEGPASPSNKVVFWLYGGAYLAGDARGNVEIAETVSRDCNTDVFLPNFGLMPEKDYNEILWDVLLAYVYLVHIRSVSPSDIIFLGISSGGGLVTRAMQAVAEVKRGDEKFECKYIESLITQCLKKKDHQPLMPSGAVLLCPFVDYTESKGAFEEYPVHDLVVTQSVIEVGVPYLGIKLGNMENRRRTSPLFRSFQGLPPLCVVLSEHEVIYDQAVELVNRARSEGVRVNLGVWKYMCHVFCFLSTFIPEGQHAMDFCCDWIRQHNDKNFANLKE